MFFSFCKVWHVPSILHMRRGIPGACLTLIYQQLTAQIAAASEARGSVCCTIYTSQGEAATPRLASASSVFPAVEVECNQKYPLLNYQRLWLHRILVKKLTIWGGREWWSRVLADYGCSCQPPWLNGREPTRKTSEPGSNSN